MDSGLESWVTYSCHSTRYCDKGAFYSRKALIFFLFLLKNICFGYSSEAPHQGMCCGYSLEVPHWGTSNEYPQYMFLWRNKRNIYLIHTLFWSEDLCSQTFDRHLYMQLISWNNFFNINYVSLTTCWCVKITAGIVFFFPRKLTLRMYANCLRRQSALNLKPIFWEKQKYISKCRLLKFLCSMLSFYSYSLKLNDSISFVCMHINEGTQYLYNVITVWN